MLSSSIDFIPFKDDFMAQLLSCQNLKQVQEVSL